METVGEPPDKILYHYTNQKGLLGILQSREIWAAHSQYLNDRSEYLHALELCKAEIADRKSKLEPESETARVLSRMEEAFKFRMEGINLCVCSFSEDSDSLPQWRAFSRGGIGFAIGFSASFLKNVAALHHWRLDKCVYDAGKQKLVVSTAIDQLLSIVLSQTTSIPASAGLSANLSEYALFLKHKSFEEEREWRIVSQPINCTNKRLCFREGKSVLIPFYKLPLVDAQNNFQLKHVVVGPTADEHLACKSVRTLLLRENLSSFRIDEEVPISISQVPYRDW